MAIAVDWDVKKQNNVYDYQIQHVIFKQMQNENETVNKH